MNNNKDKAAIIYKDNIYKFGEYFNISDIDEEDKMNHNFKIILIEFHEITDRSYMFCSCNHLEGFQILQKKDKDKKKENSINPKNFSLHSNESGNSIYTENSLYDDNEEEKENLKDFYENSESDDSESLNTKKTKKKSTTIKNLSPNTYKPKLKLNNLKNIFSGCSSLRSLPDISSWNSLNVKDMIKCFLDVLR